LQSGWWGCGRTTADRNGFWEGRGHIFRGLGDGDTNRYSYYDMRLVDVGCGDDLAKGSPFTTYSPSAINSNNSTSSAHAASGHSTKARSWAL